MGTEAVLELAGGGRRNWNCGGKVRSMRQQVWGWKSPVRGVVPAAVRAPKCTNLYELSCVSGRMKNLPSIFDLLVLHLSLLFSTKTCQVCQPPG